MNIQATTSLPIDTQVTRSAHNSASPSLPRAATAETSGDKPPATSVTGTHPASNGDIQSAVGKVQSFIEQQARTDLSFAVDDETNIRVIKVIDRSTKEVIRQIPSEEMLQMAQALDKLQGLLLKQKA